MKYICTTLVLLCLGFAGHAQQAHKDSDYKKYPLWIDMIKDPNVNYFEALKAYDLFWQGKPKPIEEDDILGQDKSAEEKETSRREIRERKKEREMRRKYGLDCKKFEHWKLMVKPYVQEDGRILTQEEQLKLWEEQQKQRQK